MKPTSFCFTCLAGSLTEAKLGQGGIILRIGSSDPVLIPNEDGILEFGKGNAVPLFQLNRKYLFILYGDKRVGYKVVLALLRRKNIGRGKIFAVSKACSQADATAESLSARFGAIADYIHPKLR